MAIVVGLLGRLCYLPYRFDTDGANFIYFGKYIADGGRFGIDLVDNKFPTVGLMTSVAWRTFGTHWECYVLLQAGLAFAAAGVLAAAARRCFGPFTALATFLAAIAYLNLAPCVYGGFQLETFQAFFEALAASAALSALAATTAGQSESQPCGTWPLDRLFFAFAAGLTAGCAAMFKPTSLGIAAAFGIVAIAQLWRRPVQLLLTGFACLAGLAVPAAVTLAYLLASDTLAAMPGIWRELQRYAAASPTTADEFIKAITVAAMIGGPALIRGYVGRRRRPEATDNTAAFAGPRAIGVAFVLCWLAFDLLGVISQGRRCAYHCLPLAGPTAMLIGLWPRRDTVQLLAATLWPVVAISLAGSIYELSRAGHQPERLAVSDYLAAHASPGDLVWSDNAARVWLETGLQPGSRVPLTFLFLNTDDAPFRFGRMIVEDLEARRTQWLILPSRLHADLAHPHDYAGDSIAQRRRNMLVAWGWIDAEASAHYEIAITIGDQTIYRRRPDLRPARSPEQPLDPFTLLARPKIHPPAIAFPPSRVNLLFGGTF